MKLKKLTYHFRLTVTEMDTFLSEFLILFKIPVEECSAENSEWSEICLNGKEIFLSDALSDYKKGIKRSRKMPQTERLVHLNKKRIKLLSGIIAYIRSCSNHFDPKIISSSQLYLNYLKEFNRFYEGSRSSLSATIRKFINTVSKEPYADAFIILQLKERTDELNRINEEYIALSDQRDIFEKNMPDSPTKVRMRCIEEYEKLVDLINLAVQNNRRYLYKEKLIALEGLTEKMQILIDRRRNHA